MPQPKLCFQKIWNKHVVSARADSPVVLYIDLHLVHEVTSPQAFAGLRERGLKVRRPDKTVANRRHQHPHARPSLPDCGRALPQQVQQLEDNCREFGIGLYGLGQSEPGHRPRHRPGTGAHPAGMVIVCGDSHHRDARRVRRARFWRRHE